MRHGHGVPPQLPLPVYCTETCRTGQYVLAAVCHSCAQMSHNTHTLCEYLWRYTVLRQYTGLQTAPVSKQHTLLRHYTVWSKETPPPGGVGFFRSSLVSQKTGSCVERPAYCLQTNILSQDSIPAEYTALNTKWVMAHIEMSDSRGALPQLPLPVYTMPCLNTVSECVCVCVPVYSVYCVCPSAVIVLRHCAQVNRSWCTYECVMTHMKKSWYT